MSQCKDCNCNDLPEFSIEIIAGPPPEFPACCHSLQPESFTVTYDDGTTRQMTDEERDAFLRAMVTPWN